MTDWPDYDELGNHLTISEKVRRYSQANDPVPDPPRVPSDGRNPPLETYPVLLAQAITIVDGPDKTMQRLARCHFNDRMDSDLRHARLKALTSIDERQACMSEPPYPGELRRITNTGFWRRDLIVLDVPPGTTITMRTCSKTGLTDTTLQKLSASLGVKVPIGGLVELGAKLSGSLDRTITTSREDKKEFTEVRTNNTNRTQRLAVWHRVERVRVEALVTPATTPDASNTGKDGRTNAYYSFGWKLIADASFEPSTSYKITYDNDS